MIQIFVIVISATLALASNPAPSYGVPSYGVPSYGPPAPTHPDPKYAFEYAVKDDYAGLNYGHQETRDGYATNGQYHVLLPDGRLQTVTYSVNGDGGYVADVKYTGTAQYDEPKPSYAPKPSYGPPRPIYSNIPANLNDDDDSSAPSYGR